MAAPEDDHLDEYLDTVLIGGREARTVEIVEYRDDWPNRYSAEAQRIAGALGATARRIDHIGSTAVPGTARSGGLRPAGAGTEPSNVPHPRP